MRGPCAFSREGSPASWRLLLEAALVVEHVARAVDPARPGHHRPGGGEVEPGAAVLHPPGAHGAGAEIGHIHVREVEGERCACGGMGCLEQVASATGIVKEAERFLRMFREPSSLRIYGKALTAKIVCDAAKEGDQLAYLSLDLSMRSLGIVLAQVSMVADPEIFVIGGGVSKAGEFLLDLIRKHYEEYTPILEKKAELVLATLGNDAGIYGCARLMLEKD